MSLGLCCSLLYKNMQDFTTFTDNADIEGLHVGTANSYCNVEDECNW